MELKDYIKLLADKDNKKKIDQPTKMPDDLDKLVKGLQRAQAEAYEYMSKTEKDRDMEKLANAINIVQFATAHTTSIYNSYYDLMNRIKTHNEKLAEKKN